MPQSLSENSNCQANSLSTMYGFFPPQIRDKYEFWAKKGNKLQPHDHGTLNSCKCGLVAKCP